MWEEERRLQIGTLAGIFLTRPKHCAQFDVTNEEALLGRVAADFGNKTPSSALAEYLRNIGLLMQHVHTKSIRTYTTKIISGWLQIAM